MRAKLTKRIVDAAKPGARDTFIWDSLVGGFGLKVTPSGKRVYVLQYRWAGRWKRYTIGTHGSPWTVDDARKAAHELRDQIKEGVDPGEAKVAERNALTVAGLAERFLAEHSEAKSKPRTVYEYRRLFDRAILPALGKLRVQDVTRGDVARLHHGLRATPYQANRAHAVLSKLFNWAERVGLRPEGANPCRHVEKFKERRRERFLSEAEAARLAAALSEAERDGSESPYVVAAVRLLMLTGARLSEVLTLRWEWVDADGACLRLPDSKTGAKVIHLNPPALEVLRAVPRLADNPHVIPSGNGSGGPWVNLEKPWRRIRARAGLPDVRLHDLRHSFAAFGAGAGLSLPMIGALLGHTQAQTTKRYAHLSADPVKQANDLIGARIAAAMGLSGKPAAEVIPLPARR